jgi:hypothetical protein
MATLLDGVWEPITATRADTSVLPVVGYRWIFKGNQLEVLSHSTGSTLYQLAVDTKEVPHRLLVVEDHFVEALKKTVREVLAEVGLTPNEAKYLFIVEGPVLTLCCKSSVHWPRSLETCLVGKESLVIQAVRAPP